MNLKGFKIGDLPANHIILLALVLDDELVLSGRSNQVYFFNIKKDIYTLLINFFNKKN